MKKVMKIDGVHCSGCKSLIEDVCSDFTGIKSASLDSKTGNLEIEHYESLDMDSLIEEIETVGHYKVAR